MAVLHGAQKVEAAPKAEVAPKASKAPKAPNENQWGVVKQYQCHQCVKLFLNV